MSGTGMFRGSRTPERTRTWSTRSSQSIGLNGLDDEPPSKKTRTSTGPTPSGSQQRRQRPSTLQSISSATSERDVENSRSTTVDPILSAMLSTDQTRDILFRWLEANPPNAYYDLQRQLNERDDELEDLTRRHVSIQSEYEALRNRQAAEESLRSKPSNRQRLWTLLERMVYPTSSSSESVFKLQQDWQALAKWSRGLHQVMQQPVLDVAVPVLLPRPASSATGPVLDSPNTQEQLNSRIQSLSLSRKRSTPPSYFIMGDDSDLPSQKVDFILEDGFLSRFFNDSTDQGMQILVTELVLHIVAIKHVQSRYMYRQLLLPIRILPTVLRLDPLKPMDSKDLSAMLFPGKITTVSSSSTGAQHAPPIVWGLASHPNGWAALMEVDQRYKEISIYSLEEERSSEGTDLIDICKGLGECEQINEDTKGEETSYSVTYRSLVSLDCTSKIVFCVRPLM
ncbi:hypothetical protein IAU59_007644 [Kwoniella sp. CBS 9459]